jgi:hypothetical protein
VGTSNQHRERGALLHPAFLASVVLLVVNDRVLKGAHVLPPAVTGKLSDVAGLIVAPVVLASLLRARSPSALLAVHAVVAAVFALTELSQSSADLFAAVLRAIGVTRATLVADPSDLWALAVLPLPYALLCRARAPVTRAAPRISLAVALLACIASPQPPPPHWTASAYVANATDAPVDVRVAWSAATPDCAALAALPSGLTLGRVVDPAIFGDAITFHLAPGDTVPIDETHARAATSPGPYAGEGFYDASTFHPTSGSADCQLVLLRAEGAHDRIVLVSTSDTFFVPTSLSQPSPPDAGGVSLVATDGIASFEVGSHLPSAEAIATDAPSTCTTARPSIEFAAPYYATGALASLGVGPDGCIDTELGTAGGMTSHFFVCGVPVAMFPFGVGDQLSISASDANHLRIGASTATLTVTNALAVPASSVSVTPGALESCNGERTACGAFVVPTTFTLAPVRPGDDPRGVITHVDATGATQILVGMSEHVLVAMPGCSDGRDAPGVHTQLAVTLPLH